MGTYKVGGHQKTVLHRHRKTVLHRHRKTVLHRYRKTVLHRHRKTVLHRHQKPMMNLVTVCLYFVRELQACKSTRMKSILWPIFEVWAGHCGCNICPKNFKFLVNICYSTSFKTHKCLPDSNLWLYCYVPKTHFFCHAGSFGQPKNFLFSNFFGLDFFQKFLTKFLNISST
jgi:hypothetical protein